MRTIDFEGSLKLEVRFHTPHPEYAADPQLQEAVMKLAGQEVTLEEGLEKLRQANRTSFNILAKKDFSLSIDVRNTKTYYGYQTLSMALIHFDILGENYD